jgi:tRNA-specific 2-thiouridylase
VCSSDLVELVTVGQRRGLGGGATAGGERRFALAVDPRSGTVVVGSLDDLMADRVVLRGLSWVGAPPGPDEQVDIQCSAHGTPVTGRLDGTTVTFEEPHRRVAAGQSVVLYRRDEVLGGGIAA